MGDKLVMHWRFLLLTIAMLVAGCVRQADVVPLNDAARAAGSPTVALQLYGTGYGPATFTMPDGEVLSGHYHLSLNGAVVTSFGAASGPAGSAAASGSAFATQTQGGFTVQAAGPRGTTIVCHGTAGGMGHGDMVCETSRQAQYQMMF